MGVKLISIYLFLLTLFIHFSDIKALNTECSILFVNCFQGPISLENGYIVTFEITRIEIERHYLTSGECDFNSLSLQEVSSVQESIKNLSLDTSQYTHVIFFLSSQSYYNELEDLSNSYPDFIFIVYGPRVFENLNNVIAYYDITLRELDVFGCYYAKKEHDQLSNEANNNLRIGVVSPRNDGSTEDSLQRVFRDLKIAADFIADQDENMDVHIIAVANEGFSNEFNATAVTNLLLKYKINCITILHNSALPFIIASHNNVYSASRDMDPRIFFDDEMIRNHILTSIKYNHTNNFLDIFEKVITDNLDELEGKYFSRSSGYVDGYSPLLNYTSIIRLIDIHNLISIGCETPPDESMDPFLLDFYDHYCNNEKDYTFTLENRLCESEPKLNDSFHFCELNYDLVLKKLYLEWNDPKVVVLLVLNSLFIVMCIISIIDLIINKDHAEFKRASSLFCRLIIIGLLLMSISIFFWFGMPNKGTCTSRIFFFGIGYSLLYSCILAKNFRVWRIFKKQPFIRKAILDYHLILKFCLPIIGIELLILILWFSIKTPNILEKQFGGDLSLEFVIGCKYNFTFTLIFIIYNLLLVLPNALLSYNTRTIVKDYKETEIIGLSIYNTILISFFVTLAVLLVENLLYDYIIITYGLFIIVLFTYIVSFIPKHYRIRFKSKSISSSSTTITKKVVNIS